MNKLSRLQKITIAAVILYFIWEIIVQIWAASLPPSDPVIRADLILIIPVLGILIIASVIQFIIRKMKKN